MSAEIPQTPEQAWTGAAQDAEGIPVLDSGTGGKKKRFSIPRGFRWGGAALVIMFLGMGVTKCVMSRDSLEKMRTSGAAPSTAQLQKIDPRTTEEYKQKLDEYNKQKSDEKLKERGVFVQPVGEVKPQQEIDPVNAPQVRIEPVQKPTRKKEPEKPKPVQPKAEPQKPKRDPMLTRKEQKAVLAARGDAEMMNYLRSLQAKSLDVGATMVFNQPSPRTERQMEEKIRNGGLGFGQRGGAGGSGGERITSSGLPNFNAGDILYCLNRVSLNSDTPGPVMVEVVLGPLKGSKVIGSFQRIHEHLVLKFSRLVTKKGMVYEIAGYGVDPKTDATAVRSSVDTHFLERWGGLVASTFLQGFGDAVGSSGSYSSVSAYGSSSRIKNYNLEDQIWMGAGKVGERAADQFEKNFSMAPTVYLKSGTEIGVLLLESSGGGRRYAPEGAQDAGNGQRMQQDGVDSEITRVRALEDSRRERQDRPRNGSYGPPGWPVGRP